MSMRRSAVRNAKGRRHRRAQCARIGVALGLVAAVLLACTPKNDIQKEPGVDAGPAKVACPKPLHGPGLVLLPATDGSEYCMDERETTRAEYDAFVAAKVDATKQPPECSWNTRFTPTLYDPETQDTPPSGPWCNVADWSAMLPDGAVGCVDFCDALAYCQWAGKRLCGRVGGSAKWGAVYDTKVGSVDDWGKFVASVPASLESEFTNACTQGGKTKFPYGDQYQPGVCIDSNWVSTGKTKAVTDLQNRQCHGTAAPFDEVSDLSGSVAEWQNLCWMTQESCVALGTTSGAETTGQDCVGHLTSPGMRAVAVGRGIRCCADPIPEP